MVDFQERDTKRGLTDEDTDAPDGDEEEDDAFEYADPAGAADAGHEHDHHHVIDELGVAVVTVSTSRGLEEDDSGDAIVASVEDAGHAIATRELVGDDHDRIQTTVDALVRRDDVDAVVTTGGTGITPDDVTIEAVHPLFDKTLPGFGELFRQLSYEEIGTRVVATRAAAGVIDGVPVFSLPGSEHAATLGTEEIVLPEAPHLAGMARRGEHGHGHSHDHDHGGQ